MNNKSNKLDLRKSLGYISINGESESARFLSFFFRVLTFLFLLPALIFLFMAHSWWGFGLFFGFGTVFMFVACYFREKTITFENYLRKEFEEKRKRKLKKSR